MEVKIFSTGAQAVNFVSETIIELHKEKKGSFNLGVATGRTMDAVYHNFVRTAQEHKLSFTKTKSFALDEYIGLKTGSLNSYRKYLELHLHKPLQFLDENINIPEALNGETDSSSQMYEEKIKNAGGIDLQLLGIGLNGHIALNEPGSSAESRTRVVALTDSTLKSNKTLFKDEPIPLTALTMGVGTILESKKCILIATGETKASIIKALVNNEVSSVLPASFLKNHKDCILVLDKAAAKLL